MLPQQLQVKCVFVHIRVCVFVCCWPTICKATLLRAIISYKNKRVSYNNGISKAHEQQIETRAWTWALITLLSAHNRKHKHTHAHTHWQMSRVAAAVIINCKFDKQLQQQQQLQKRQHASRPETLHDKSQLWKLLLKSAIFSLASSRKLCLYCAYSQAKSCPHKHKHTHTLHTHTHTNTHIVLVCCVSACVPKKKKPNVESQLRVLVCCCGYTLYFTHTHAHTHTTSATYTHTLARTPHTQ